MTSSGLSMVTRIIARTMSARATRGTSSSIAGPPSFEPLVTALINELDARPADGGVALVLDDYHLVGCPPVHESLGFLLEHRPTGLHPVLASRADPPLALARLRARGQLAELRDAEHLVELPLGAVVCLRL